DSCLLDLPIAVQEIKDAIWDCGRDKALGLPIGSNMSRCSNWFLLIDRFQKRLSNWKAKTLSIGGRITLTKVVLGSLGVYFFFTFKAPKSITKKLESIRRNFFWGGCRDEKKIAWIAWDKNFIWSKSIRSLHGPFGDLHDSSSIRSKSGPWYQIARLKEDLIPNGINLSDLFSKNVGNCKSNKFRLDKWLGVSHLSDPVVAPVSAPVTDPITTTITAPVSAPVTSGETNVIAPVTAREIIVTTPVSAPTSAHVFGLRTPSLSDYYLPAPSPHAPIYPLVGPLLPLDLRFNWAWRKAFECSLESETWAVYFQSRDMFGYGYGRRGYGGRGRMRNNVFIVGLDDAVSGRMVERENHLPQQPPQVHPWLVYSGNGQKP
nr:hypothetical protein [Tanacetum cinerariifolium]